VSKGYKFDDVFYSISNARHILVLNRGQFEPFASGCGHERGVVLFPWPFPSAPRDTARTPSKLNVLKDNMIGNVISKNKAKCIFDLGCVCSLYSKNTYKNVKFF
jgi:hypothetical protein